MMREFGEIARFACGPGRGEFGRSDPELLVHGDLQMGGVAPSRIAVGEVFDRSSEPGVSPHRHRPSGLAVEIDKQLAGVEITGS